MGEGDQYKIDKPLVRLTKTKREKTQKTIIRNEIRDITTDPTVNDKITREYYEQLYTQRFENSEEMDQYLKNHKLPKLNQEEIVNLNSLITFLKN